MALCKLERGNYDGKSLVSIKYQNLHTFKEGLILLCQSILEMKRITHLHGSAHFAIPLNQDTYHITIILNNIFLFQLNSNPVLQSDKRTAMRTKCKPPYVYFVVGYIEKTKLFSIELTKFFSTEEIKLS